MWEEYRKDGRKENRMGQTGIDEKKVHMAEKDKENRRERGGRDGRKRKKRKRGREKREKLRGK